MPVTTSYQFPEKLIAATPGTATPDGEHIRGR